MGFCWVRWCWIWCQIWLNLSWRPIFTKFDRIVLKFIVQIFLGSLILGPVSDLKNCKCRIQDGGQNRFDNQYLWGFPVPAGNVEAQYQLLWPPSSCIRHFELYKSIRNRNWNLRIQKPHRLMNLKRIRWHLFNKVAILAFSIAKICRIGTLKTLIDIDF